MTEQVQELINKIKTEGIQEAQSKAQEMEAAAQKKADDIIASAEQKALHLMSDAKAHQERLQEATQKALAQTARDMLLKLRQEICAALSRIADQEVHQALSKDKLADLIEAVIKGYAKGSQSDGIVVLLGEKDYKALKDSLLVQLKKTVKQGVTIKASAHVSAGFTISFDEGRSSYEFTDETLVDFLSRSVNEDVAVLLNEAVKQG